MLKILIPIIIIFFILVAGAVGYYTYQLSSVVPTNTNSINQAKGTITNLNKVINATNNAIDDLNNNTVKVYLVALDDNGKSGELIGCGDSLVAVDYPVEPTGTPTNALNALLAIKDEHYGQSGLYNALYQSNLKLEDINVDQDGTATVNLSGNYVSGGVCDDPRAVEQVQKTVLQFRNIKAVNFFINDKSLTDIISAQN